MTLPAQTQPVARMLSVDRADHGWMRVRGDCGLAPNVWYPHPTWCITLLASSNLVEWGTVAVLHDNVFDFRDATAPAPSRRYYRFAAEPITETNDWKNQIAFTGFESTRDFWERFLGWGGAFLSYVKFVIPADDPTRVFYSDSTRYLFHYDYVSTRLAPFVGLSPSEFERITRYNHGRRLFIGSVLMGFSGYEYGIQFDAADPLPLEIVGHLLELVKSTVMDFRSNPTGPMIPA
jgi:hypothetical protein